MAYADLKADIIKHIKRPNLTSEAGNFVARGEDVLNRKLPEIEATATLACTIGSRTVDLSSLAIKRPNALFLKDGTQEIELDVIANMARTDDAGRPRGYEISREVITFERPCDAAYSLRLVYIQRFALSDAVTTNWLLENHYDAYLAASLVAAYARQEDLSNAGAWQQQLGSLIRDIKIEIASFKRADLRVDPALQQIGRRYRYHEVR